MILSGTIEIKREMGRQLKRKMGCKNVKNLFVFF